ncbi:hypothetical protein [Roseobacter sinensis]|uniref:Uncharacterized protein n=1 Tax=Roseobacter sinensis TaxID=2931391 RepID=A0ABT3BEL5_9RHOB|nr:hypothetical protein [Roseobacter sp. WL0113]MCV3272011.1 hypothetical protein [Roseobacter sp. WL0113]
MKKTAPLLTSLEKACFQVVAHGLSRLLRREMRVELRRLERQPKIRSYLEVGSFLALLFALSIVAASLGWIAFGAFFLLVIILFR